MDVFLQQRGVATLWIAGLVVGGLPIGCGSSNANVDGGNTATDLGNAASDVEDAGGDAVRTTDVPLTDTGNQDASTDGATVPGPCLSATAITGATGSDGAVHVTGTNAMAPDGSIGSLPSGCPNSGTETSPVVYTYTMRTTAYLIASTDFAGSAAGLDSVVSILSTCASDATALACNDNAHVGTLLSTAATASPVPMGTTVFVVVAGNMGAMVMTGAFNLGLQEVQPRAVGTACSEFAVCAPASDCLPSQTAPTQAMCIAEGSHGGLCAGTDATCNAGLACSASSSTCVATAGVGASCDAAGRYFACVSGTNCTPMPSATNHAAFGCVTDGSIGGKCLSAAPECTGTSQCAPGNFCQNSVAPGGTCDLFGDTTNCTTNSVCAPSNATSSTCVSSTPEPSGIHTTVATAVAPVTRTTVYSGSLNTPTDVDCYGATVPAGGSIYTETEQPGGPLCDPAQGDTVITLYNPMGTVIANNNFENPASACSRIDPAVTAAARGLAGGQYTVCVATNTGPVTGPSLTYTITLAIE